MCRYVPPTQAQTNTLSNTSTLSADNGTEESPIVLDEMADDADLILDTTLAEVGMLTERRA
jgi:hypothetical protein